MSEFEHNHTSGQLGYRVFTVKRPGLTPDIPPGYESLAWVANSATLIYGARDAVLVDTFLTLDQSVQLADEVAATGKTLTHVYITHGHGDHFFGLSALKQRFPGVRAVATAAVIGRIASQLDPDVLEGFWRQRFPGQIPDKPEVPESLDEGSIELEGHALVPVHTGFTDTADSTSLHVPSIGLIAAGDVVYNGIHPYLGESSPQTRLQWIEALDKLDTLNPRAVVAGHKIPDNDDDPKAITQTRDYLRDFIRLDQVTGTPRQLFEAMIELYPDRANPGSLWGGANAAKRKAGTPATELTAQKVGGDAFDERA
jgi:glyoxylase-like metal-dependent hydrolase (beta-lactamase superfamily II)